MQLYQELALQWLAKYRTKQTSPILAEIQKRQQESKSKGQSLTRWQAFASMVQIQTGGTVKPFIPYLYQVELVELIESNQNTVICKSRQMGISETVCCYMLLRALTEPGFSAVVFSKTQGDASELGRRVRDMAISLGPLCPTFQSDSATKIVFKDLGRIHLLPVTPRAARGIPSVSIVMFDEAAFIDGVDGVYQAAMPTLSMLGDRGKVVFNSTPNGRSGLFYRLLVGGAGQLKQVTEALQFVKQNAPNTRFWEHQKWAKALLHWRCHPIYGADPDWADKTRVDRKLSQEQWDQEYELSFAAGSRNVFQVDLVEACANGEYSAPIPGHRYIAGIDPNMGGSDYYTLHIWDVTEKPYRLAAQYREQRKTKDYSIASTLNLIDIFRPRQVNVESNSGGALLLEDYAKLRPSYKWEGVCTTNASKLVNTDRLVLMLERKSLSYPSGSDLATELQHFVEVQSGTTRQRFAEAGFHDDTVMATAIAFAGFVDNDHDLMAGL
jgi:hypothetical protein